MQSDSVVISYKGAASDKLMENLMSLAQVKIGAVEQKKTLRKKLIAVLVEILQNVLNHAQYSRSISSNERELEALILVIAKSGEAYSLMVGNLVDTSDVQGLKVRIDEVNSMSREEIKAKYITILGNGEVSEKGGAGLGIVDIARKAGTKLDYEFSSYNDKLSFFSLMVNISAT